MVVKSGIGALEWAWKLYAGQKMKCRHELRDPTQVDTGGKLLETASIRSGIDGDIDAALCQQICGQCNVGWTSG